MAKLALPELTSGALLGTRAGLLWRVTLRAARKGEWTGWADYVAEELASQADGGDKPSDHESASIVELFEGRTTDPEAVELATKELCRGLGIYLEALPPRERVRSAGRLATALSLLQANTSLSPFKFLTEVKDEDQASIWQAVLSHLVTRDRAKISLEPWLDYVRHLPEALVAPWNTQMVDLDLSETTTSLLKKALAGEEEAPEPPPVPAVEVAPELPAEVGVVASAATAPAEPVVSNQLEDAPAPPAETQESPDEAAEQKPEVEPGPVIDHPEPKPAAASEAVEATDPEPESASTPAEPVPPPVPAEQPVGSDPAPIDEAQSDDEQSKTEAKPAPPPVPVETPQEPEANEAEYEVADELVPKSKVVTHALERTEEVSLTDDASTDSTDRAVPVKVFNERVIATSNEQPPKPAGRSHQLSGGYGGRLLPAPLRALATVTGIVLITAILRLLFRFIFGLKRTARLWLDHDTVVLETYTHLFGKEMKRARRSFGPEGLLSVVREVRYPQIYLFVGLFALCFGALTGTIAFLDGQLAGFETWIQTGLILIVSGLVVDFIFSVLFATRPGRTSLTLTFNPRATLRLLGVKEAEADEFMSELVKRSHEQSS